MNGPERPTVIPALVDRHALEAAFYWSQLDHSCDSSRLTLNGFAQFSDRIDAHLEGLVIAGPDGIARAFSALDRWKKPGEAFVCAWLATHHDDEEVLDKLAGHLQKQPDSLLRGVVSALVRLPEHAGVIIHRWTQPEAAIPLQVAALRSLAILGRELAGALARPLTELLASPTPFVRAAACRVLARMLPDFSALLLHQALKDEDRAVRAEAAIALALMPDPGNAGSVLWECVAAQATSHGSASGWFRMQAMRRLNRWLRYLAWLAPPGHADLPALFDHLPARAGLTFALYHGDTAHLPRVIAALADPETTRYAGWVWQALTGVDLEACGLTLPEPDAPPEAGPITESRLDADNGLPLPDAEAIGRYPVGVPTGVHTLLGRELTAADAIRLLEEAPQSIRAVAAQYLHMTVPGAVPCIRASAPAQRAQIGALRAKIRV